MRSRTGKKGRGLSYKTSWYMSGGTVSRVLRSKEAGYGRVYGTMEWRELRCVAAQANRVSRGMRNGKFRSEARQDNKVGNGMQGKKTEWI